MHLLLFCIVTNKCTIISEIITPLHVSTILCHPQGACNQFLAQLHTCIYTYIIHLNFKSYYQQLHLKCLCNLARYWLQALWRWHDSVEACRSTIICETSVQMLVILQINRIRFGSFELWLRKQQKWRRQRHIAAAPPRHILCCAVMWLHLWRAPCVPVTNSASISS